VTKQGGAVAFASQDGRSIYYAKKRGPTSLWRVPVGGGKESQVLGSVAYTGFVPAEKGIYFIPNDRRSIRFQSFASGEISVINTFEDPLRWDGLSLSVSPDERSILFGRAILNSDLMLVEDFR
jgi:hypothetical protein